MAGNQATNKRRELSAILEGEQNYLDQYKRSQKQQALLKTLFPAANKPETKPQTVEDREALKIRKYEEMFKKQAEMEARKIKRREQKEMTKTGSDPLERKDNDNSASKKGEKSKCTPLEPPVFKRPRLESAVSIKTERSLRVRHEAVDKEISRISSGSKKSVTDRKKNEHMEVNESVSDNNSTAVKKGKVLSKALTYSIKKNVFDKFKEENTRQSKKTDASNKGSSTKKTEIKAQASSKKNDETRSKPTPDTKNKGKEVMKLMAQSGQGQSIKKVINQTKLYKKGEEFGKKLRDEDIAP